MESSREIDSSRETFQKLHLALYSMIWLIGTIGCLLVMFVIIINSKLNKYSTNIFLLNLAIADFVNLQGILFFITVLVNQQWMFSVFTCKLFWTMVGVNQFTAVFILTLLAFDRYLAVCRQDLSSWRKVTGSRPVLAAIWLLSITCLLPVIIFSNIDTPTFVVCPQQQQLQQLQQQQQHQENKSTHNHHHHNHQHHHPHMMANTTVEMMPMSMPMPPSGLECNLNETKIFTVRLCTILWPENNFADLDFTFTMYGFTVSFVVPIVLIAISYSRIIFRLESTRSNVSPQLRAKQRERRKVTYLVLVIIGIYILTYTPYWVFQILLLFHGDIDERLKPTLSALFQLLVYTNSALNPFIYAFMSVNFRSNLRETFKCGKVMYMFRHMFRKSTMTSVNASASNTNNQISSYPNRL